MKTFKNKSGIFSAVSINKFDDFLKAWVLSDSIYYLGSYIYDINDQYQGIIEHWAGEGDGEKANEIANREDYKSIHNAFSWDQRNKPSDESKTDSKQEDVSITECIQKKYLNIRNQILHLYRDSESNYCQLITRSGEVYLDNDNWKYEYKLISSLESLLTDIGQKKNSEVKSTFEAHFDSIKKAPNSHIYFFPTILNLSGAVKIINVSTVVSPSELKQHNLAIIQAGLEASTVFMMSDTADYLKKLALSEAEKSAKAAIMSRNMSHNLGSHVMSYLKHHLSSVKDMFSDGILSQLFDNEQELFDIMKNNTIGINEWNKKFDIFKDDKQNLNIKNDANNQCEVCESKEQAVERVAMPFLVGLGQFISYLQERQDFIATIATDYVPYYSCVNFKDFIYDEINNDKRYERHPDRSNLKPDNILLGNIARSEGLGRMTTPTNSADKSSLCDIVLKFRTTFNGDPVEEVYIKKMQDGNEVKIQLVNPLEYYSQDDLIAAQDELDAMRRYEMFLPGGVVGRQAVFSIFENVIRNAAKHGNWREAQKLELTIDIFEKEDILDFEGRKDKNKLKDRLVDDKADDKSLSLKDVLSKYYINSNNKNSYYFVTLTDNLSCDEESLVLLRHALIEKYVDPESGVMLNTSKGIKEMRISSSWLRSTDDNLENSPYDESNFSEPDGNWLSENKAWEKEPPILYVRRSKDKQDKDKFHLQYIFCMIKPQKVVLISDKFRNILPGTEYLFIKRLWRVLTPNGYIDLKNKSFDIVVYDNSENNESQFKEVRRHSPSLFICLSDIKNTVIKDVVEEIFNKAENNNIEEDKIDDILKKGLSCLYEHLSDWDGKEKIYINDEKAEIEYNAIQESDRCKHITFSKQDADAQYRYQTHLEEKNEFKTYVVDDTRWLFSEGITGNNSTDRLIRNEVLNDTWFFKHLFAIKQKIAIFDERIFSKAFGVDEPDFSIPKIEDFGTDFESSKKELIKRFPNQKDRIEFCQDLDDLNNYVEDNNLKEIIERNNDKVEVDARCHLGATYASKSVLVFSIIRSIEDPQTFNLYGYQKAPSLEASFSKCVKYAVIHYENDKLCIKPEEEYKSSMSGINYISIHQGLLDKMYGAFNIKKEDTQMRENLTKEFFEKFTNKAALSYSVDEDKCEHYFLPGMTIHSGRSKPSNEDMPQRLPFIPYSAIEHATLDCKYSLVQLLNSARYE